MSGINDFNAAEAKKLVDLHNKSELHIILTDIKCLSEKGKSSLHIRHDVTKETIEELIGKGFQVTEHSSLAIQKDNLYFSIKW